MARYVVRRLLQMVLVLFGASMVLFVCLYIVPGDPIPTQQGEGRQLDAVHPGAAGEALPPRQAAAEPVRPLRRPTGPRRHGRVVHLPPAGERHPGREAGQHASSWAWPPSPSRSCIGLIAGIVAAISRYSFLDVLVTLSTTIAIGIPTFVIGLAFQQVFAINLDLAAAAGHPGRMRSPLILPAVTLASVDTALVARLMRGTMLEVLRADYIRTATAKGLSKRVVIFKHALRNSIIPVLTYLGITFGTMLGGALITETIFNWDGVGLALVNAVQSQDNPVVLGRGHLRRGRVRAGQPAGRPVLRRPRPPDPVGVADDRRRPAPRRPPGVGRGHPGDGRRGLRRGRDPGHRPRHPGPDPVRRPPAAVLAQQAGGGGAGHGRRSCSSPPSPPPSSPPTTPRSRTCPTPWRRAVVGPLARHRRERARPAQPGDLRQPDRGGRRAVGHPAGAGHRRGAGLAVGLPGRGVGRRHHAGRRRLLRLPPDHRGHRHRPGGGPGPDAGGPGPGHLQLGHRSPACCAARSCRCGRASTWRRPGRSARASGGSSPATSCPTAWRRCSSSPW